MPSFQIIPHSIKTVKAFTISILIFYKSFTTNLIVKIYTDFFISGQLVRSRIL